MSKNIVDSHFHVFNSGEGLPHARYKPTYDATMADWQQLSQKSGVQRGVLVQTSFMGTDNTRLLRELAAEPDNLRGIVVIAPDVDTTQFPLWHAAGVRGIRLNLAGTSHDIPDWRSADPVWSAMCELGWHLELHTDVGGMPKVLQQLPSGVPLVVDHMGKPDRITKSDPTVLGLLQRSSMSLVYIKLSGAYRLEGRAADQAAKMWLDTLGAQHLLWGSDWPCTNHESEANYGNLFKQLGSWLGAEWAEQVLVHNPSALYWVNSAQPLG
jgi:predicted TIM-barrel fold metal-dependent hydrolase